LVNVGDDGDITDLMHKCVIVSRKRAV
jgi:hypothetical protein